MANMWPFLSSIEPDIEESLFGLGKSVSTLGTIASSVFFGWLSNKFAHTKFVAGEKDLFLPLPI